MESQVESNPSYTMIRLSLILIFVIYMCIFLSIPITFGQDTVVMKGSATLRGHVIDTSPKHKSLDGVLVELEASNGEIFTVYTDKNGLYEKTGLPAGRYTINAHKKGYGSRIKAKFVSPGGEGYDRIKMRKRDTIFSLFYKRIIHQSSIYLAAFRRIYNRFSILLGISE